MDLKTEAGRTQTEINAAMKRLDIAALAKEHEKLLAKSQQSDFWNDSAAAQKIMQKIAKLETRTKPWQELSASVDEVVELAKSGDPAWKPNSRSS